MTVNCWYFIDLRSTLDKESEAVVPAEVELHEAPQLLVWFIFEIIGILVSILGFLVYTTAIKFPCLRTPERPQSNSSEDAILTSTASEESSLLVAEGSEL